MPTYHNNFINPTKRLGNLDSDGYGGVVLGGAVNVRTGTVIFSQNGVTAYIATLPKGAEIVGWQTVVKTAFDDTGTDLLDIGDGTTANRFADNIDISTTGQKLTGYDPDEYNTPLDVQTQIFATYTGQNSNAAAGEADVSVFFIVR